MSKPSSRSLGSCSCTPRKPPHERGKSSYQEPKRASVRSTSTSSGLSSSVASVLSCTASTSSSSSGASAACGSVAIASPTVRLTGQRPPSTVGAACSILIRLGGLAFARAGTSTPLSPMRLPRTSGVQLHVTSLPDGKLGASALAFVDWLAAAGQSWWQVLPLGPPNRQRSPYKAASAFAAWRGLLADPDAPVSERERAAFRARHGFWIDDWAAFAGGTRAINDQVRFEREWSALRVYARERGVRLIGDVPIYVAAGSADEARWPELFRDDVVAGVPPDQFTSRGQLWGNPIYDWRALRRRRYRWWVERLRRTFSLFDVARIDHFRGFAAYWAVPRGARDASGGRPGRGAGRGGVRP